MLRVVALGSQARGMNRMQRKDFRFRERLRVRWAEIDAQDIVFNAHYLMYFDTAIAGYWRALALPYHDTLQRLKGDLYVRKATLEYEGSARYDDVIEVGVRCQRVGNSSLLFHTGVLRAAQLLVKGELVYVFADPRTQTSLPVPAVLREILHAYESGKPMLDVRCGSWTDLGADARRIRGEVFIDEQRIPADLEWDEIDPDSRHAVAYNRLGVALATGRWHMHVPGVVKIGRVAVVRSMRGSGIGHGVLEALMRSAREAGFREAVLHAQSSAAPFYARLGFVQRGPAFDEAGIEHIEMTRAL
jgi:YbgC/YbaW family acyl-CoA thioester hydrolase